MKTQTINNAESFITKYGAYSLGFYVAIVSLVTFITVDIALMHMQFSALLENNDITNISSVTVTIESMVVLAIVYVFKIYINSLSKGQLKMLSTLMGFLALIMLVAFGYLFIESTYLQNFSFSAVTAETANMFDSIENNISNGETDIDFHTYAVTSLMMLFVVTSYGSAMLVKYISKLHSYNLNAKYAQYIIDEYSTYTVSKSSLLKMQSEIEELEEKKLSVLDDAKHLYITSYSKGIVELESKISHYNLNSKSENFTPLSNEIVHQKEMNYININEAKIIIKNAKAHMKKLIGDYNVEKAS